MQTQQRKQLKMFGIGFICASILLVTIFSVYAQTLSTMTLTGGIYPAAPSWTVFTESGYFYGKTAYGEITDPYSNYTLLISDLISDVSAYGGTIYLKGTLTIPSGLNIPYNVAFYNELGTVGINEPFFVNDAIPEQTIHDNPRAYYFDGTYRRTYIAYQSSDSMNPYVTAFDHDTKTWFNPVKVGTNPLPFDDFHGAPNVIVSNNGYIHVFYGAHATTLKHTRSTNPEDLSSWTAKADMGFSYPSYPVVVKLINGTLIIFARLWDGVGSSGGLQYQLSSDNGETWGAVQTVIDFAAPNGFPYFTASGESYDSGNGRIHVAWDRNAGGIGAQRLDAFHAYLRLNDKHMYSMSGTDLGTTIDYAEAEASCKVFESGTDSVEFTDVSVSPNGTAAVLWHDYSSVDQASNITFTKWTGSAWATPQTIPYGTDNQGLGYVKSQWLNNTAIEVYAPLIIALTYVSSANWGGGDIVKFLSIDNGATFQAVGIIPASIAGYPFQYAGLVEGGAQDELKVIVGATYRAFWGQDPSDWEHNNWKLSVKLLAYGDNGFVYRRWYYND